MSNVYKIKQYCISNGEGIRTAIFFSGCTFHCKNCFNKELWDFNKGEEYNDKIYNKIKDSMNDHISGISILGGEPLHPKNIKTTLDLCNRFKKDFPNKTIWLWTGFLFEEVKHENLSNIDIIVDGQFIEELKDYNLKWRGSCNQRIINVKESLNQNKIVLLEI